MRWLIVSDIHDNRTAWRKLMARLPDLGVERVACLGDVGRDAEILADLERLGAICVCGNWEVSGHRRLPRPLAEWVAGWPMQVAHDGILFCHASPEIPPEVTDTRSAAAYVARGIHWLHLFPRLHRDEEARWRALAAMEARDLRLVFHGHTHVQEAWVWSGVRLQRIRAAAFRVEPGSADRPNRYLVGVGSLGAPLDGSTPRFALYDEPTATVSLCELVE